MGSMGLVYLHLFEMRIYGGVCQSRLLASDKMLEEQELPQNGLGVCQSQAESGAGRHRKSILPVPSRKRPTISMASSVDPCKRHKLLADARVRFGRTLRDRL